MSREVRDLIVKCWDQDPEVRPAFQVIYEDIDHISSLIKETQVVQYYKKSPYDRILDAFGVQEFIHWTAFLAGLKKALDPLGIRKDADTFFGSMKYCLASKGDYVYRTQFEQFMKWFTPLVVRFNYNNASTPFSGYESDKPVSENGWDIDQVVAITSHPKFFGLLSREDERTYLLPHEGCFLFRFSSIPPHYSVSVNHRGIIVTWRIECQKASLDAGPRFFLGVKQIHSYAGFEDIVYKHSKQPLPSPSAEVKGEVVLKKGLDRNSGIPIDIPLY